MDKNGWNNMSNDYRSDLPAPRVDDLPLPLSDARIRHLKVSEPVYPDWVNISSQRHVWSIAPSKTGDLWLATGGGMLCWHGGLNSYTRFTSEHGLPGNHMVKVVVDDNNCVWAISLSGRLYYLQEYRWNEYIFLKDDMVDCLSLDQNRQLWVGTSQGIYEINSSDTEPISIIQAPVRGPRVMAIIDHDNLWAANSWGIFHWKGNSWEKKFNYSGVTVMLSQASTIWLGTANGLQNVDIVSGKLSRSRNWPTGEVTALAENENKIWVAHGRRIGIASKDGDWQPAYTIQVSGRLNSLLFSEGSLLVGSDQGLLQGKDKDLHYLHTETPPDTFGISRGGYPPPTLCNLITSLSVQNISEETILWLGTAQGLFSFEPEKDDWKRIAPTNISDVISVASSDITPVEICIASWKNGIQFYNLDDRQLKNANISSPVTTIVCDKNSFIVANMEGVIRVQNNGWIQLISVDQLPSSARINALAKTESNILWIGTSVGLFRYDWDTKSLAPEGSSSVGVLSLVLGNQNGQETLFICTPHGLIYLEGDVGKQIPKLESFTVTVLAWDSYSHKLWVGTQTGLFLLSKKKKKNWAIEAEFHVDNSGLAAEMITSLAFSKDRFDNYRLWIGTPNGLCCYSYH
jgi:ligand-binding sensor domain-containing protein